MKEEIKEILILFAIFGMIAVAGSYYGFSGDDIVCVPSQEIKF